MYLNVDEVESGIKGLANTYPQLCQLIELPNRTHEGRFSHALRIGKSAESATKGILFTASAHAREWGGADCAVRFAADLLEKYSLGAGVAYGNAVTSPEDVKTIVDEFAVFVFPCVNPDGRHFSQTQEPLWRKNRRQTGHPMQSCMGIDINRNFDFLWDYQRAFHPDAIERSSMASNDPCSEKFRGASPNSEPETKNVVWLLDTFPQIGWLLDIHSYTGDMLHSWGVAPNQTKDPDRNFRNPAFDGLRGVDNVAQYGEYIPSGDLRTARSLASDVCGAIASVRGQQYVPKQSFYLSPGHAGTSTYPTGGTVDDYAYSRHFADPSKKKVFGFTLEFGLKPVFAPAWDEMVEIVKDVCAGMFTFCLQAGEVFAIDPGVLETLITIDAGEVGAGVGVGHGPLAGHGFHTLWGGSEGGGLMLVDGKIVPVPTPEWTTTVVASLDEHMAATTAIDASTAAAHEAQLGALDRIIEVVALEASRLRALGPG